MVNTTKGNLGVVMTVESFIANQGSRTGNLISAEKEAGPPGWTDWVIFATVLPGSTQLRLTGPLGHKGQQSALWSLRHFLVMTV